MPTDELNEKGKELEEMKKLIPELQELANRDYYHVLFDPWKKLIKVVVIAVVIGVVAAFVIAAIITTYFPPFPHAVPWEAARTEAFSGTVFSASLTINALSIAIVPVISFFFIGEIKEHQDSILKIWEAEGKEFKKEKENLGLVNSYYGLASMMWHNVRSGVAKYTRTYLFVSVSSLLVQFQFFNITTILEYPGLNVFVEPLLIIIVLSGIYPIIHFALYKPALKFAYYFVPAKIITRVEFED